LVKNGIDINHTTKDHCNALFSCVMDKRLDLVQYLVEEGIDINCKSSHNDRPIDLARTKYKNKEIYEYLKKKELKLNEK